ncbi:uncharacterized protein A4U43_C08F30890, partial [Asparagus officinalis]
MHSRSAQLSYRDRTQEFLTVTERLKKSLSSQQNSEIAASASKFEGTKSSVSIQSEFNKRASKIGLGIHQTSQKLSKLAKLAKRTSVFDDPTVEIQELTAVIKQDITALNSAVVDLQLLCNSQNESGGISSDTTSHTTTVVDNLKTRLMSATKEFKEVLTMRTENLKVHENRRQLFSSSASKDATNPFVRQRPLVSRGSTDTTVPPAPWANDSASSSSSQLFPSRIDENMDDTLANVEGAQGQLLKYLNSISSNRWLMIKIFFVNSGDKILALAMVLDARHSKMKRKPSEAHPASYIEGCRLLLFLSSLDNSFLAHIWQRKADELRESWRSSNDHE